MPFGLPKIRKRQLAKALIVGHRIYEGSERIKLWRFIANRNGAAPVALVAHPLPNTLYPQATVVSIYADGKLERIEIDRKPRAFKILAYAGDFLLTSSFIFRSGYRWDVYFGINPIYAAYGIFLRTMGFSKMVVFWSTDYWLRYGRGVVGNWVFHALDRFCLRFCDFSWNASEAMLQARRIRAGGKHLVVPLPILASEIRCAPAEQVDRNTIVYAGPFGGGEFMLILAALSRLRVRVPSVKLLVMSYEPPPKEAERAIARLNLQQTVACLGFVSDEREFGAILQRCRVGLAPYDPASFKRYADPGRIKTYIAKGVAVVTTRATELGKLLEQRRAGIVVDFHQDEVASAVERLIMDDVLWEECRGNATTLLLECFETSRVFRRAFRQMGLDEGAADAGN
jgi:glycosyltransferase involved in cell wall biosynthesis